MGDAGSETAPPRQVEHAMRCVADRRDPCHAIVAVIGNAVGGLPAIGDSLTPNPTQFEGLGVYGGINGLVLFGYWTALEGRSGQSAGKMVLDLQVVDPRDGDIGIGAAAIESFGKAILLPLDCLIGWLSMLGRKLRLFNRLSNTIVIEVGAADAPEGVEYVIPEE